MATSRDGYMLPPTSETSWFCEFHRLWQLCGSQFMLKHHHMAGLLRSKALKICTVQHNECHLGNPSETAASFQFTFKKN